jgi:dTDP-glucose 4,6-dehydratase
LASEADAEVSVLSYCRIYGLDVLITRCMNNFGPYQFPEKQIPKVIIRASIDIKVPLHGTGIHVRDSIYVLDHYEALQALLERGEKGEIYNILGHTNRRTSRS